MKPWEQKRVFLFSHPRTASNLLVRLLSNQPDWETSDYLFFDAFQYTRDAFDGLELEDVPETARAEHSDLIEQGHQKLENFVCTAMDKQKHVMLKDHTLLVTPVESTYGDVVMPTNPSIFPDTLMLSWRPVILIRNPILIYESWLRAEGEPYPNLESQYAKIYTTLKFQRAVFDWYRHHPECTLQPIVLNADDIIERQDVLERFCELVGMEKEKLVLSWKPSHAPAKFALNERFKRFLQTFQESTGIERSKSSVGITLEERQTQWRKEFGPERASMLVSRVVESWPDFQYLRSMRLC
ncbi:uncharacterized protein RCC_07285 [Ramularia collo-cygni]|uniref:Sulfotransferase domain-containing protein n=1 Tax=Ramularia collo-cygni TaxID=112498 RepID=A0A2D3UUU4_9PEZI|nr:uncharacterized protein RCC_07285 [Ramularia collo-cygni]CZT21422.1 uncharacterized protein RCC_07285 [Ramularia collo-cygni]